MKRILHIMTVMILLISASCSGVKNLKRPQLDLPDSFAGFSATDSASLADMDWWVFYSDSTLCHILRKVVTNNRNLLTSSARVEELKKLYGVRKADMLPVIGGGVYANHEHDNYHGDNIVNSPEFGLKIPIAWEINLWGSLVWAKKEGKALWMASEDEYRALQVSLVAEAAETYFRLIALENELIIVKRTAESRAESMNIAKIRWEGGLTSETAYRQAEVEYATAAALVPELEKRLRATKNELFVLMGEYPQEFLCDGRFHFDLASPETFSVGVPSSLLKRRPDVRAAEQKLAAAMANAGYAYADRFPTLTLGFTPGHENDRLKDFFKSPFSFAIGSISGTFFDFGRKKRQYEAAVAAYEQARLEYEQVVIEAFAEVETAINAYRKVRESSRKMMEFRDASARYVELARLQYSAGTLNYIDVLDAERSYFEAQISLTNAIRDEYINYAEIYKVLGGGW